MIVKPRMPSLWGKPGHEKRAVYCKRQLKAHMPFKDKEHFNAYVHGTHQGDFEAAYEAYVKTSGTAPQCCEDDFRETVFYNDGEEVPEDDMRAKLHPDLDFLQAPC